MNTVKFSSKESTNWNSVHAKEKPYFFCKFWYPYCFCMLKDGRDIYIFVLKIHNNVRKSQKYDKIMAGNVTRVPGLEDPGSGPEIKCRVRVWTRIPLTALTHTINRCVILMIPLAFVYQQFIFAYCPVTLVNNTMGSCKIPGLAKSMKKGKMVSLKDLYHLAGSLLVKMTFTFG